MPDKYASFAELSSHESEGTDFRIVLTGLGAQVVLAPHGGGIEPGTSEIACEVAGGDFSLYLFEGLKSSGNADLHVTSHHFEEPRCISLVDRARSAMTIHGCVDRAGVDSVVFIGGSNVDLRDALVEALTSAGFPAEIDSVLTGRHSKNICNRPMDGGVQLEISERARLSMFASLTRSGRMRKQDPFWVFCEVLRTVLSAQSSASPRAR